MKKVLSAIILIVIIFGCNTSFKPINSVPDKEKMSCGAVKPDYAMNRFASYRDIGCAEVKPFKDYFECQSAISGGPDTGDE